MKMQIHIKEYLPSTVTTRNAVGLLSKVLPTDNRTSVVFDFSDIDFVSRAFADELIHLIQERNISADFQNANSIVREILNVVGKNRNKRNSTFHNIAVTRFIDKNDFANFLSLI